VWSLILIVRLVYSVQAIVISTEVAHNIGFSELNAVLLGSAIRIAQCLGLHKINPNQDQLEWREMVETELGKRVWCQMIVQDLFAIPFNGSHGMPPLPTLLIIDYLLIFTIAILPLHCSTDLLTDCDDDLIPQPTKISTISSYGRILAQCA
jgi:hypothetical protein